MAKSFWSDGIQVVAAKSPLAVVSEAASQLAKITQGLVEANVRSSATKTGYLIHRLYIEAPALGYEVRVASFAHEPTPLYPVWADKASLGTPVYREGYDPVLSQARELSSFFTQGTPPGAKLQAQEDLEAWLTNFLGEDNIKNLVNGLIATVSAASFGDTEER